ncbi:hypothetical protein Ptr902_08268 [Pyrenophora tritici-repentis]|nr:hypothetical protein Ptr902_08268 [Pyrenophora tritici-repentis]
MFMVSQPFLRSKRSPTRSQVSPKLIIRCPFVRLGVLGMLSSTSSVSAIYYSNKIDSRRHPAISAVQPRMPLYRNKCRLGKSCNLPYCAFVHPCQKQLYKDFIETLDVWQGGAGGAGGNNF